jgi:hypothetical protein
MVGAISKRPRLRSVDGLNTHDDVYELAMIGGVTSAQVRCDIIGRGIYAVTATGAHAFILKLRKPQDRSVSSMIVDSLNTPAHDTDNHASFRWEVYDIQSMVSSHCRSGRWTDISMR